MKLSREKKLFQKYPIDYKQLDTSSTVWENSLERRIPKGGPDRWFMLNWIEETWVKPQSLKSHPGTGDCQEEEGSAASSSFNDVNATKGGLWRNSALQRHNAAPGQQVNHEQDSGKYRALEPCGFSIKVILSKAQCLVRVWKAPRKHVKASYKLLTESAKTQSRKSVIR